MITVLYWLPRVLGILSILFISVFSLDVFEAGESLASTLIGFLIHNIPSFVLIAILALAWKHERIGGFLFIGVSLLPYLLFSNPLWVNVILCAPFLLTGLLFLLSARYARPVGKGEV